MRPFEPPPVESWCDELTAALRLSRGPLKRVCVLNTTDSTQDAARRLDAQVGDVIVAARQTNGRGRMGRAWHDTDVEGVAMTLIAKPDRPERMAVLSAVAVCFGLTEAAKGVVFGIKWPNDIVVGGRKVAGILIEQEPTRALIGIGINVGQQVFPESIADRAASLEQLGVRRDRLSVMRHVLQSMSRMWEQDDEVLSHFFSNWDVLAGSTAGFRIGEREIRGKVLRVDPMKGLAVLTETEGEVWLPAATTSVIKE